MALFAIADLHLSLGSNKPMDSFPGWKDYVARLKQHWLATVTEKDTVVVAGDVSWGMSLEESYQDFAFLHALPGDKLLLKGNHDYWWSTKGKMEQFFQQAGFDSLHILHNNAYLVDNMAICGTRGWLYNAEKPEDVKIVNREVGRLQASLDDAKKQYPHAERLVFLHYPPVYGAMACREILETLSREHIARCYYGHIHGNEAKKRALRRRWNGIELSLISADSLGFCPCKVPSKFTNY